MFRAGLEVVIRAGEEGGIEAVQYNINSLGATLQGNQSLGDLIGGIESKVAGIGVADSVRAAIYVQSSDFDHVSFLKQQTYRPKRLLSRTPGRLDWAAHVQ